MQSIWPYSPQYTLLRGWMKRARGRSGAKIPDVGFRIDMDENIRFGVLQLSAQLLQDRGVFMAFDANAMRKPSAMVVVSRGVGRASVDFERACRVAVDGDAHRHHVLGQELLDLFGPFDQAEVAREKILS